ncbi:hypothetical protein SAY87_025525 [Trapa incisa]|uniref:Uncharacterized protein n=1 Tax=Trapa incisa TaxID=236973 RepID=A0AAN7JG88_9MYRT|nr:hypothetical protein SAY87_025525 [Trapa incisa]
MAAVKCVLSRKIGTPTQHERACKKKEEREREREHCKVKRISKIDSTQDKSPHNDVVTVLIRSLSFCYNQGIRFVDQVLRQDALCWDIFDIEMVAGDS